MLDKHAGAIGLRCVLDAKETQDQAGGRETNIGERDGGTKGKKEMDGTVLTGSRRRARSVLANRGHYHRNKRERASGRGIRN